MKKHRSVNTVFMETGFLRHTLYGNMLHSRPGPQGQQALQRTGPGERIPYGREDLVGKLLSTWSSPAQQEAVGGGELPVLGRISAEVRCKPVRDAVDGFLPGLGGGECL